VAIGAGFVFCFWLPLALIAVWLGRLSAKALVDPSDATAVAAASAATRFGYGALLITPVLASFALAAWAGGAVIGRFGGKSGPREGGWAATLAAIVAAVVAALGGGAGSWLVALASALVLAGLGCLFGWLGGRWGIQRR
jgi:hypothetical protein